MSGWAGWGDGYVTDVDYLPGWYPQQSPMHLALACLLLGVACDLPAGDDDVHYLELGCGLGFGAMTLAAANPSWRVTGVDFNPAHIAQARAIAREAGLRNVAFLEADLAALAEEEEGRRLPQADFVSLHGVWSWVSDSVRAGIIRLLRAKVRAGGIVHASYNALPGWQGVLGMQRLLLMGGEAAGYGSEQRATAGFALVNDLMAAEAIHLAAPLMARRMVERIPKLPAEYVTHEYMNRNWSPCFHADVAEAFAGAKLDWVGSATLTENFTNLMLTEAQRAVYARTADPRLRELIKDTCLPRLLRHDIFVRGAQRIAAGVRVGALRDLTLALITAIEDLDFEVEVASGTASLSPDYYSPILTHLAAGPSSVAALMGLPVNAGKGGDPTELVGMLVGIGHCLPLLRPGLAPDSVAQRFNRVAARWVAKPEHFTKTFALASVAAGGGVPATVFDLFVNDRHQAGEDLSALAAWVAMLDRGGDPAERDALEKMLRRSAELRLPLMRAVGVV